MAYSAVIHPLPVPTRNGGTTGSTVHVHRTVVAPPDQDAPGRVADEAEFEGERTELIGLTIVRT